MFGAARHLLWFLSHHAGVAREEKAPTGRSAAVLHVSTQKRAKSGTRRRRPAH